jgi:hypothetical protein
MESRLFLDYYCGISWEIGYLVSGGFFVANYAKMILHWSLIVPPWTRLINVAFPKTKMCTVRSRTL